MASLEVHVAAWGAREGQPWAVGCLWKKLLRGSFWWCGVFVFFFFFRLHVWKNIQCYKDVLITINWVN